MELRHLRYFQVLGQTLNFTRAAEQLHIAQPPLSRQIQQLEDELGVLLLERTRPLRLTEAGRFFYEHSTALLEQLGKGWRPDLLFALDEHGDTDWRTAAERSERSEVNCEAALVVSYATAIKPPIALGRDKGRRTPAVWVAFRLDVVVGVEADGRHSLRRRKSADDGRRTAIRTDHADIWTAQVQQQLHNALGTALHLCSPRRVSAHRLDGDERCQIGENAGKLGFDPVTKRHVNSVFVASGPWRPVRCPAKLGEYAPVGG